MAACLYCRAGVSHEGWCPTLVAGGDLSRPSQSIATEDWARGLLRALAVPETASSVGIATSALQGLHRFANDEGFGLAAAHVVNEASKDEADVALKEKLEEARRPLRAVGVIGG